MITGRCYCGAVRLEATAPPLTVAYCHCADCRRATGAPVAAFAAFAEDVVRFIPDAGRVARPTPGVARSFCESCGSPLAGRYDYLPGMVYIALGVLDQADSLPPQLHAYADQKLQWLHIQDDLERSVGSARATLNDAADHINTEDSK